MPLVNIRKKISLLFLRFLPEFRSSNIFAVTEHTRNQIFLERYPKFFFFMLTWVLLDGFLNGFSNSAFIIVKICILIWDFWVIFKNYSMRMLSIRGNDFIAHWAYEETISSHTEHTPNEFSRMLSQRKNVNSFYMYCYAEHTWKWFCCTLSIPGNDLNAGWAYEGRGNDFIADWAYAEMFKSRISRPNKIFKNLVLQALRTIRIRFLKKSY